jgi:hypothetical protein
MSTNHWKFQIYASPLPFPLNTALHTWIITTSPDGTSQRYEVFHYKNYQNPHLGYLHQNSIKNEIGLKQYPWNEKKRYTGQKLYEIQGNEGSLAHTIVHFVEKNTQTYAQKSQYNMFLGPNCNTFTQWILKEFPETIVKLPWNAYSGNDILQKLQILSFSPKLSLQT